MQERTGPETPTKSELTYDSSFETAAARLKEWFIFSLTEMKSVDLIDSDGEQELVIMYDKFLGDPLVIPRFSKKWYYNCDIDKWGG